MEEEMSNNSSRDNASKSKTAGKVFEGLGKGQTSYYVSEGSKHVVKFAKSGAVNVLDTTIKGKNKWVFRLDAPHANVPTNHLNINPKISGFADPHIPLPNGSLTAGKGAVKVFRVVNKVALPVAIAIDGARVGISVYSDCKNGTSRNTVETVANVGGAWGGGFAGAELGAALGTAILPGIGTIAGAFIGGISGAIGCSFGVSALTKKVADAAEFNIKEAKCVHCCKWFKWRKYKSKYPVCPECEKMADKKK